MVELNRQSAAINSNEVKAKLAARDAHSLADAAATATAKGDRIAAEQRVGKILKLQPHDIVPTYINLVKYLKGSDLTINFVAYRFFNSIPSGKTYDNQFGGNAQKWGGDEYMKNRDVAEEAMFDFSGVNPKGGNHVPASVIARLKKYGQFDTVNVDFEPISRPKYCAYNYTRDPQGAAKQWGKSFIVLKDYMKQNCTFVESDSFDFTLGTVAEKDSSGKVIKDSSGKPKQVSQASTASRHVASYFQIDRLFIYLAESMIIRMYEAMLGKNFTVSVGSTAYVETHIHGELRFDRDIEKLVISKEELADSKIKTSDDEWKGKYSYLKTVNSSSVKANIEKFAKKNGIRIVYV